MENLLESCKIYFNADDLYQVFGLPRTSSISDGKKMFNINIYFYGFLHRSTAKILCVYFLVKKAYHHLALVHHPDKISERNRQTATKKFALLNQVYNILVDTNKKKAYDEGNCIEIGAANNQSTLWSRKITNEEFNAARSKYIGSESEENDIIRELNAVGNASMTHLLNNIPFMRIEDEPRIIQ